MKQRRFCGARPSVFEYTWIEVGAPTSEATSLHLWFGTVRILSRVTVARGRICEVWRATAAPAMGLGICFIHYIGMLAFQMAMPFEYDWLTVWNAASGALRSVLEPR